MLIWVFVAITLVCIATVIVMDLKGFDFDYHVDTGVIATIIIGVLIVAVIIMTGIACVTNITADSYAAEMEQRYKSLTYQLENDMYDNENEYGKKALYDQVQDWNEKIAVGKINQENFWVGIFYPHVYDQFEFIELPEK